MNKYYDVVCEAKKKIKNYLDLIFQVSGDELLLELEHYNLLTHTNNCIESSTATGYIMEEFITSKLSIFTRKFIGNKNEIVIKKLGNNISTVNSSYDCFGYYKGIMLLINIKVEKNTSSNNAVASINILNQDYVEKNADEVKSYLILKTHYKFGESEKDKQRKIIVIGTECYALEEVDFKEGHLQDHRNWTTEFNPASGRLQISKSWLENHRMPKEEISYENTKQFIKNMAEVKVSKNKSYRISKVADK